MTPPNQYGWKNDKSLFRLILKVRSDDGVFRNVFRGVLRMPKLEILLILRFTPAEYLSWLDDKIRYALRCVKRHRLNNILIPPCIAVQ